MLGDVTEGHRLSHHNRRCIWSEPECVAEFYIFGDIGHQRHVVGGAVLDPSEFCFQEFLDRIGGVGILTIPARGGGQRVEKIIIPLGLLVSGLLADTIDVRLLFIAGGTACFLCAIAWVSTPIIMRLECDLV